MAVEDLGLNVFVEGFQKFERQMDAMDKSIDELEKGWEDVDKFSRKASKGMDEVAKSNVKVSKTLEDTSDALEDVADETEKVSKKSAKMSKGQQILAGAMRAVGENIVGLVKDLPRMAVELAKAGAASLRQSKALDNLAKAAGTSGGAIVSAIQEASDFTIDKMTAMSAANKAMLLDVAKTPEQFEKLTKVATTLGRAMGLDAAKSIDDFVTAAGRQSIMIADNLGLTIKVSEASEAYAKKLGITVKEMDSAQKKQAFLNAMLEAGEVKMAELGESTLDAAGSIERAEAQVLDLKTALGEKLAPALATVADMLVEELTRTERITKAREELIERIEDTSTSYDQYVRRLIEAREAGSRADQMQAKQARTLIKSGKSIEEVAKELGLMSKAEWEAGRAADTMRKSMEDAGISVDVFGIQAKSASDELPEWKKRLLELDRAYDKVIDDMDPLTRNLSFSEEMGWQAEQAMVELAESVDGLADSSIRAADDNKELANSLIEMETAALDMGMTWKSYYDDVEERAADFATRREEADIEHQENMATILQEQLVAQGLTLQDYYDGRLIVQDENIQSELAAEQLRYDDELALINEQQAKQEEAQRQSLGRMILQQFDAWATMKGIPADRMLEMRLAIASEYDLIDEDAAATAAAMVDTWETWADDTSLSADRAISAFDNITLATKDLKAGIDAIPREIDITASFEVPGMRGRLLAFQKGTMFVPRTGLAMLHQGEAVLPQNVATILRQNVGNVTNNVTNEGAQNEFNFTAQSLMQPGQMQMEFSTMAMAMRNR